MCEAQALHSSEPPCHRAVLTVALCSDAWGLGSDLLRPVVGRASDKQNTSIQLLYLSFILFYFRNFQIKPFCLLLDWHDEVSLVELLMDLKGEFLMKKLFFSKT